MFCINEEFLVSPSNLDLPFVHTAHWSCYSFLSIYMSCDDRCRQVGRPALIQHISLLVSDVTWNRVTDDGLWRAEISSGQRYLNVLDKGGGGLILLGWAYGSKEHIHEFFFLFRHLNLPGNWAYGSRSSSWVLIILKTQFYCCVVSVVWHSGIVVVMLSLLSGTIGGIWYVVPSIIWRARTKKKFRSRQSMKYRLCRR